MTEAKFSARLREISRSKASLLCLGIDPDQPSLPEARDACNRLLQECLDICVAVKFNLAFFEQWGSAGLMLLEELRFQIKDDALCILDGKRGDIGSSATAYARALFETWHADAATVNPLMGADAVAPFLRYPGKLSFLLTRTSNSGASDFLNVTDGDEPLYLRIAKTAQKWPHDAEIGFVTGATDTEGIAAVRAAAPEAILLIPGVGAQGGDLAASVKAAADDSGGGFLIAVSRGIARAGNPREAAVELRDKIEEARDSISV